MCVHTQNSTLQLVPFAEILDLHKIMYFHKTNLAISIQKTMENTLYYERVIFGVCSSRTNHLKEDGRAHSVLVGAREREFAMKYDKIVVEFI